MLSILKHDDDLPEMNERLTNEGIENDSRLDNRDLEHTIETLSPYKPSGNEISISNQALHFRNPGSEAKP